MDTQYAAAGKESPVWSVDIKPKIIPMHAKVLEQIHSAPLRESEQVLACCIIAREKLEVGDYDAGCSVLRTWWKVGESPSHQGLSQRSAAELLLTTGVLTDSVARAKQPVVGQGLA